MTKKKGDRGDAPLKGPPRPAVAKHGAVKPKQPGSTAAKPGNTRPAFTLSKGKENSSRRAAATSATPLADHGKKRARPTEQANQHDEKGKRNRNAPARFGSFHQPSPSVASPDSQVQNSFEPVGAAEAREADVLNKVAQTMLGPYLEEDEDAPTMKEKFEPLLEQLREDRAAAAKSKAEAKQKAQQAEKFIPVDQRKLASPIKKNPELERQRAALLKRNRKNQNAAQSTNMATPSGEVYKPSPQPQTADPRFQALESEVANLREHLVAKEGEVEHLTKNQQAVQQQNEDLQRRLVEAENENKRITAELSEAQSTNKKMAKTKKEQTQRIAGFKELGKQMDEMSKQMEAYNAQMATMKRRLQELEAVQSS